MDAGRSFNPWYVGGGVKSICRLAALGLQLVSILGMLEGVLKERERCKT